MGQYNRLGQRRAGGAWQWLIIGFFPGLLCGALVIFLLLLNGVLNGFGGEPEVREITSEPIRIVVTATFDSAATQVVQVVTATPAPTEEAAEGTIVQPTLTPFATAVVVDTNTDETAAEPTTTEADATTNTTTDTSTDTASTPNDTTTVGSQSADTGIPSALADSAGTLVQVTGGEFQMGTDALANLEEANLCVNRDGGQCEPSMGDDATPQVLVSLDTFWIEQTEVTFEQYVNFLNYQNSLGLRHTSGCQGFLCIQTQNERPSAAVIAFDGATYFIPANFNTLLNHPAYGVTWYGAVAYCEALGRRLPTEAEWEYAARDEGDPITYPFGNDWNPGLANVRIPAIEGSGGATIPVDAPGTGTLGLVHMAGNVAEWVNDYYSPSYYTNLSAEQQNSGSAVFNPQGPAGGTQRVLRGGSFDTPPFFARTVHRQSWFQAPENDQDTYPLWVGFRCVSDTGPVSPIPAAGSVNPSDLAPTNIPSTGTEGTDNAQPTTVAPADTESESDDEGARG